MEDTNTIITSGDTRTLSTAVIKGTVTVTASTMPEGLFSTTSAITMNNPTSTTESVGSDIDHFTTGDQTITTTELESDKKGDVYVVIADSKLNTVLSATALAIVLVVVLVLVVAIVFPCVHKRRAEESKSAKIELTNMKELTIENMSPAHNTYTSPVHNHYFSEEKSDIM